MRNATPWLLFFLILAPVSTQAQTWSTDINCDGSTNVVDVMILVLQSLGEPLSSTLDADGDNIPDACQPLSEGMNCGSGTQPNAAGDTCVVSQALLEQIYADGAASVDITSDNQSVADDAYGEGYADGYADGFADGVASVNCDEPGCVDGDLVETTWVASDGTEVGIQSTCNAGCFGYASNVGVSWGYVCDGEVQGCPNLTDNCSGSCAEGIVCQGSVPSGNEGQVVAGSRRVFVTSVEYPGNMGGLAGADSHCQERADIAGLGGTWKAWLSDSNENAKDRLTHPDGNLVRVDGVIVATDWDSLVSGWPVNAPEIDEFGQQKPYVGNGGTGGCGWAGGYFFHPWTATNNGGTLDGATCNDWTSTSGTGRVGLGGYSLSQWTTWCDFPCDWEQPLYCFEQ